MIGTENYYYPNPIGAGYMVDEEEPSTENTDTDSESDESGPDGFNTDGDGDEPCPLPETFDDQITDMDFP